MEDASESELAFYNEIREYIVSCSVLKFYLVAGVFINIYDAVCGVVSNHWEI